MASSDGVEESDFVKLENWSLNSMERLGIGLLAGFVTSATLRRRWPIALGLGLSAGCNMSEFPLRLRQGKVKNGNGVENGNDKENGNLEEMENTETATDAAEDNSS